MANKYILCKNTTLSEQHRLEFYLLNIETKSCENITNNLATPGFLKDMGCGLWSKSGYIYGIKYGMWEEGVNKLFSKETKEKLETEKMKKKYPIISAIVKDYSDYEVIYM